SGGARSKPRSPLETRSPDSTKLGAVQPSLKPSSSPARRASPTMVPRLGVKGVSIRFLQTFGSVRSPRRVWSRRGRVLGLLYAQGQASSGVVRFGEHVTTARARYDGRSR